MCRSRSRRFVSVIFSFEEIKSHRDISAFDIAILVKRQGCKHEHGNSPLNASCLPTKTLAKPPSQQQEDRAEHCEVHLDEPRRVRFEAIQYLGSL